jgi:tetratricopeptide (TPR) repeat protein
LVFYGEQAGRFDAAEEWSRLALAEAARAGNPPAIMTNLYNNLGNLRGGLGRYDEAITLYRRAIEFAEKAGVLDAVAMATNNLAATLRARDNSPEALPLYRRAYTIWNQQLGPTHPNTLMALENVADYLVMAHLYDDAEASMKRDLQLRERTLGPDHPDGYYAVAILCDVELARGHYAKAEELAEHEIALVEKGYGASSWLLVDAYRQLGRVYLATKRPERARKVYERAVDLDHHDDVLMSAEIRYGLADALVRCHGDATRAQSLVVEAEHFLGERHDAAAVELRGKIDAWKKLAAKE